MIKYLMQKTIFKETDSEKFDILFQLVSRYYVIEFFCFIFLIVIYIFPFIPLFIINIFENVNFSIITKSLIIAFILIWSIGFLIFLKIFKKAMFGFSELLAERIYFLTCTKKGKAISKNDFETIKQTNKKLYTIISTQNCQGYCYSVCFSICKILKKGSIEFIAIKDFSTNNNNKNIKKEFTMHVLYVNNGWAFDTNSSRQYPIEKLHEIYKAKIYKVFDFDSIHNKTYNKFMKEQKSELVKWSNINDCSVF